MVSYDDLFALRVSLHDDYSQEPYIIKQLKSYLLQLLPIDEIDEYLHGFYKSFEINISIDDLKEIKIDNNISTPNILSNNQNESDDEIDNSDQEQNDSDDEIDNSDEEQNDNHIFEQLFGSLPPQQIINPFVENELLIRNIVSNDPINTIGIDSLYNSIINIDNSGSSTILNNIIIRTMEDMEDVKLTLNENDFDNIKNIKFTELQELELQVDNNKCTICMSEFVEDDDISIIKCNHVFHQDCIKEWLLKYSYKCPVCRHEAGTVKINI
jgi:hypothetical protein